VLRLEEAIRFQQNHYMDFDKLDIDRFASSEWEKFVAHEGNEDFKDLLNKPELTVAKAALVHHIFSPFRVMEGMRNAGTARQNPDFDQEWDLNDPHLSVYTYVQAGC
jgi:hypothetical protein